MHGRALPVWTLDFESYWDRESGYSLNKMTTTAYVRDPRFKAHGVSVIEPDGTELWVTHKDLREFLASVYWPDVAMLCQNTYFDGLVASHHYQAVPGYYLDTMSMSYGEWGSARSGSLSNITSRLGIEGKIKDTLESTEGIVDLPKEMEAALEIYAIQDSVATRNAFVIMYKDRGYPEDEMHIIDITVRAYADPKIVVDAALCRQEIEEEDLRLKKLLTSGLASDADLSTDCVSKLKELGISSVLRSAPCFAELLRSRGVVPPMKPSPTNPANSTYAFGKKDLELQALAVDPRVSDLVAARMGVKSTIRKDKASRILEHSVDGTQALPVPLKYCGGRTHRWSGWDKINLQNLPSGRDGLGSKLRNALTAPPGFRFVVVDASQIEARVNAWAWQELGLLDTFTTGGDPYSELASTIYGVHVTKNNEYSHLRPVGKAAELALGFGMGVDRFFYSVRAGVVGEPLEIGKEEAERAVRVYRALRTNIVEGWNILQKALAGMVTGDGPFEIGIWQFEKDRIMMPNELYMHYKDLQYVETGGNIELIYLHGKTWTRLWGSKLDENLIQSTARSIVAQQAVKIAKLFRIVLLVHDEIVFLARENEADEALEFGLKTLKTPPPWCKTIPLNAEGGHSHIYNK